MINDLPGPTAEATDAGQRVTCRQNGLGNEVRVYRFETAATCSANQSGLGCKARTGLALEGHRKDGAASELAFKTVDQARLADRAPVRACSDGESRCGQVAPRTQTPVYRAACTET